MGAFVNVVVHPDEQVALELAAVGVTMFARFSIMHGKAAGPVDDRTRAALDRLGVTAMPPQKPLVPAWLPRGAAALAYVGISLEISYRLCMRTPLGTITSYDGPGENTEPPRLLLAMGHPAEIADGCLNLFRSLVKGALSPRDRKLATLAVASATENAYEWHHHVGSALTMDITQADIDAIKAGETHKLAPHDRMLVELGQAIERRTVTDQLWTQAAAVFDTEQLVQLTVLCAYYGMLGRVQAALEVDQDEGFASAY